MPKGRVIKRRIKTGVDDPINDPSGWRREINRLEGEINKNWKSFGDNMWGAKGANGMRIPTTANKAAAGQNIETMNKYSGTIGEITRYLKSLKR
jgi:hypothetical protein